MKAGSVRSKAGDRSYLKRQEKHAKRLDDLGKKRRIRDEPPLVYGSLDLEQAYDEHVAGAKKNGGAKNVVLHSVLRFPPELLSQDVGPFSGSKLERQQMMLDLAVQFTNQTQGGNAVFAARLDRDELGETVVDVFYAPVYEKRTKRTREDQAGEQWVSLTKFNKELAELHRPAIEPRLQDSNRPDKLTSPRAIGMAMQEELGLFMQNLGVNLEQRNLKDYPRADWISKEEHDLKVMAANRIELETQATVLGLVEDVIQYKRLKKAVEAEARYEQAEAAAIKSRGHELAAQVKIIRSITEWETREERISRREAEQNKKELELAADLGKLNKKQSELDDKKAQLALDRAQLALAQSQLALAQEALRSDRDRSEKEIAAKAAALDELEAKRRANYASDVSEGIKKGVREVAISFYAAIRGAIRLNADQKDVEDVACSDREKQAVGFARKIVFEPLKSVILWKNTTLELYETVVQTLKEMGAPTVLDDDPFNMIEHEPQPKKLGREDDWPGGP